MKKQTALALVFGFLLLSAPRLVFGDPIQGNLCMTGYMAADSYDLNALTFFSPFDLALTNDAQGDYASAFPEFSGQNLLMGRIYRDTPDLCQWEFGNNDTTVYQFQFTSFDTLIVNGDEFYASGSGIAEITGFDDTLASWVISGSRDRIGLKSHAAFTASGVSVPEGSQTAVLFITGLAFLVACRRLK